MPVGPQRSTVDERLVRRLLAQFELDGDRLRKLAEGWDNSVWVVDARYAFRFPRREVAIPGSSGRSPCCRSSRRSCRCRCRVPAFVGEPAEEYPWPFFGAELIPGVEAGVAELDDEARLAIALELAAFLRALHAVELETELPHDPNGREDMPKRVGLAREELAELERLGLWHAPPSFELPRRGASACRRRQRRRSRTATSTSATCSSTAARRAA